MSKPWLSPEYKKRPAEEELDADNSIPVDAGLIRCTCLSTQDDGFTIQCEHCLVWQHAYCVHITPTSIPDHFLCDQCSKKKRPKLSKRIAITKKKLSKLDLDDNNPSSFKKKKQPIKSRVISRYASALFEEARERWKKEWKYDSHRPFIYDMGAFVSMDAETLLTQGAFMNAPVSNQGLFATRTVHSSRYLMEVAGDILLKSEFKFDPLNDFVLLGTSLSHIMFFPALDLCVDTRQFGNKARYIRRSCQPNAELRNMALPRDDKSIHLGLFARRLIEKGQEVTVGWAWQRGHVTWKEYMDWHHKSKKESRNKVIDEEEERKKRKAITKMLERFEKEFGSCACLNKQKCFIEHLKRQCTVKKQAEITRRRRSKPSILLLKPRPVVDRIQTEEYVDITSNSPPLKATRSELPHELSMIDENHHSDDLSSLSSLSSLSATEEKEHHPHSEGKSLHSATPPFKSTALLPRKKLWARDYLSKVIDTTTVTEITIKEEGEIENKSPVKSESNNIPGSHLTPETSDHETQANTTEDIPTQDPAEHDDESELSDASTVLLEDICA
ncbi:hypothetical protein CU098_001282 [Rhizopus stolonifer]|uniref:SET domain-containing protein n=1 Tax=Rhizopus stolonifer TaxID=4846 RepID=A0A367KHM7_RHIST|nr:hypothetical protein CU098_001282 [Rhizopus stolonifer]